VYYDTFEHGIDDMPNVFSSSNFKNFWVIQSSASGDTSMLITLPLL